MTVDDGISNTSGNRPFQDVLATRISRRTVMTGSLATAAVAFFGSSGVVQAGKGGAKGPTTGTPPSVPNPLMNFAPLTENEGGPVPNISSDYEYQVLIPWGTPLFGGVPDIDGGRPLNAADAERQVGIGHDGMWFYPFGNSSDHGVLCINHEYGTNPHVLGGNPSAFPGEELAKVKISQAVHGVSVVEIKKVKGRWEHVVDSPYNRRITPDTDVVFDGPAAGSDLLQSGLAERGTLNNCGNGYTPWGTYLTCEENFNGYFGYSTHTRTAEQKRYGFNAGGFGYQWAAYDKRFDLGVTPREENRFGWIMEIDPMAPGSKPVKHTALGRFKHEGFAFATGRGGRAVGYMGDDERFDYIYKFVSASNWKSMRARGKSPFSEGSLYVARFNDNGTGDWLELTIANPVLAKRFGSQAEVLTYARIAGDLLGATPMDRPEWTSVAPNGDVYCALTNNTRRTEVNAANPQAPNPDGHIIRWRDADNHVGTTFEWDIFLFGSDSAGTDHDFNSPDGLWLDVDGRVFIQTDGDQRDANGTRGAGNNQMLVANPTTREVRRLLTGVAGDEITGIAITPDRRTLFCNTQHPGDGDPALSNFPVMNDPADPKGPIPRDATFVLTRKDRGIVGS